VDESVDKNFAHRTWRDQRAVDPLQLARLDTPRKREMALAEELGLLEELEGRAADLPLVEKLGLVHPAKASHAQLALRVVGHERLSEENDRRIGLAHEPEALVARPRLLQIIGQQIRVRSTLHLMVEARG
jgi:hypothetical protein